MEPKIFKFICRCDDKPRLYKVIIGEIVEEYSYSAKTESHVEIGSHHLREYLAAFDRDENISDKSEEEFIAMRVALKMGLLK